MLSRKILKFWTLKRKFQHYGSDILEIPKIIKEDFDIWGKMHQFYNGDVNLEIFENAGLYA